MTANPDEQALETASRMIFDLVRGLITTPDGLTDVMTSLAASVDHADDPAEADIARRVIAQLEKVRK